MIKKITCICIILLLCLTYGINIKADTSDFSYDDFIAESKKHQIDGFDIEKDVSDSSNVLKKLAVLIFNSSIKEIKSSSYLFFGVIVICMISSLLNTLSASDSVAETSMFGCSVLCSTILTLNFGNLAGITIGAVGDLCDFMNVTFPGYSILLASSGYTATASSMQGIFVVISNVVAFVFNKYIVPFLYYCAIMCIANTVADSEEITKFIKLLMKYIKYIIGFSVTIFGAIIGFTGFVSSSTDGIALKTAKYAVSNFVPVVGGCLADTLNGVICTSVILKNTVGYIATLVIIMICLIPVIKLFIISFLFKSTSFAVSLLLQKKLADNIETVGEIIGTLGALLTLLSVIFILLTGIIASVGG